jgi:hypothetical protein
MEEWTTPKQISVAMLIVSFACLPQVLSVPKQDWTLPLEMAVGFFAVGIPVSAGYFLRPAKLESPHGTFMRNLHDAGFGLSLFFTIAGLALMLYHLGCHHSVAFVLAIALTVVFVLVGAHADGELRKGDNG